MTDTVPDAAVQIAREAWDDSPTRPGGAWLATRAVVAALARAGWLHDPAEVAALRGHLDVVRAQNGELTVQLGREQQVLDELRDKVAALRAVADAARALGTYGHLVRPHAGNEHRALVIALAALDVLPAAG